MNAIEKQLPLKAGRRHNQRTAGFGPNRQTANTSNQCQGVNVPVVQADRETLGDAAINVDLIVQNISHGAGAAAKDLSFTVDRPDLHKANKVIEALKGEVGYREVSSDEKIGKLSIVGVGMKSHSGVAGKMFDVLAKEGVNIDMILTSEIKSPS